MESLLPCSFCGSTSPQHNAECPTRTSNSSTLLRQVQGFRLLRQIQETPNSKTYLAEDENDGGRCLVRFVQVENSDSAELLRRLQSLSELNQPQIIRPTKFVLIDGEVQLVIDLIDEQTLQQRIQEEKQIPLDEAVRIVRQLIHLLQIAAEKGLFHGSIDSSNVLIGTNHRVYLDGFLMKPDPKYASFIAPEILAGNVPNVRSDIYSLGILISEMIGVENRKVPSPLYQRLTSLIARMCNGDPSKRPASYREMLTLILPIMSLASAARESKKVELYCPFCKETISRGKTIRCATCGTAHHAACWKEHGKCSVFNCAGKDALITLTKRQRLVLAWLLAAVSLLALTGWGLYWRSKFFQPIVEPQKNSPQKITNQETNIPTVTAPVDSPLLVDLSERQQFTSEIKGIFGRKEFEWLDRIAADLRSSKERFSGGDWKLLKFYRIVAMPEGKKPTAEEWQDYLASLRLWIERNPESITPRVALGQALVDYAWDARGSGYIDSVTEAGYSLFKDRLKEARNVLEQAKQLNEKCPHWFVVMQNVAKGQGWSREEYEKLFEEGITFEPLYYSIYSRKAEYLMPRWHGEPGEWEKFADEISRRIGGKEGSIIYSSMAYTVSQFYKGAEFYDENKVDWKRIKQGFLDRESIYGPSYYHLNMFLRMAGMSGDRATMRALLPRIGEYWDSSVWKEKKYFDSFKDWANR